MVTAGQARGDRVGAGLAGDHRIGPEIFGAAHDRRKPAVIEDAHVLRKQADGRWLMVIDHPYGDHIMKQ